MHIVNLTGNHCWKETLPKDLNYGYRKRMLNKSAKSCTLLLLLLLRILLSMTFDNVNLCKHTPLEFVHPKWISPLYQYFSNSCLSEQFIWTTNVESSETKYKQTRWKNKQTRGKKLIYYIKTNGKDDKLILTTFPFLGYFFQEDKNFENSSFEKQMSVLRGQVRSILKSWTQLSLYLHRNSHCHFLHIYWWMY